MKSWLIWDVFNRRTSCAKVSSIIQLIFLLSIAANTVIAQTQYNKSDFELSNDVIKLEEYQFKPTTVSNSSHSEYQKIIRSQFKNGQLLETAQEDFVKDNKLLRLLNPQLDSKKLLIVSDNKTHYFYNKDKHGNWLQRLSIHLDPDIPTQEILIFSTRIITYKDGTTSGNKRYDFEFVSQEFSQYMSKAIGKKFTVCKSGNCQNGYGEIHYGPNNQYIGNFINGQKQGKGIYHYANGDVYDGWFKAEKMSGQGTYNYQDGSQYKGQWLNNQFHGKGIYSYSNGNRYDGEWKNGKFYGIGNYYDSKSNKIYKNNYKNGVVIKNHVKTPKASSKIVGCIKGNCQNGTGTFIDIHGTKYVGEFKKDQFNGYGKFYDVNGKLYYEGQIQNGKQNGKGRLYGNTGIFYQGDFVNNKFKGIGKLVSKNGLIYHGEFKNSQFNGKGFYITKSGKQFIGHFRNNMRQGKGITFYLDGSKESCLYINDKCEGLAETTFILGNSFKYGFKNGVLQNPTQVQLDMRKTMKNFKHSFRQGCIWGTCQNGLGMLNDAEEITNYTGFFINGEKSIFGHYQDISRKSYIGEYLNNKRHGIGYFYDVKKKKKYTRLYKHGRLEKTLNTTNIPQTNK